MAQQKTKRSRTGSKKATARTIKTRVSAVKGKQSPSLDVAKTSESAKLPGPIAQTRDALAFLKNEKGLFFRVIIGFWLVLLLVIGISQQAQYQSSREMAELYTGEVAEGPARKALEIGVLILSTVSGGQNAGFSESQQIIVGFVFLFLWLTVVWLIRHRLAETVVSFRDAVYSAGAPIVSIGIIALIGLLQLLPFTIGLVIYSAAGVALQGTALQLLAIMGLFILAATTLYWLVATVFSALIVTIPGTYPLAALRSARALVAGQRTALLLRLLWVVFAAFVLFLIGVALTIAIDRLLPAGNTLFVAAMVQFLSLSLSVFAITYVYLFYRKVVDARS